jgi:S1-C subfamily serine protease
VKLRVSFGVNIRDLNDAERQELQTNQGVVVMAIVDDSPAFKADVLAGDVIAAIDGVQVPNVEGYKQVMAERKGKEITVTLIRRGERITKTVQLNN